MGTKTAWQVVLTDVIKSRYIYEFDLKGFFNNVDVFKVMNYLEGKLGLSSRLRDQIEVISVIPQVTFPSSSDEDHPEVDARWDTPDYVTGE